jgi:hypothetical protein
MPEFDQPSGGPSQEIAEEAAASGKPGWQKPTLETLDFTQTESSFGSGADGGLTPGYTLS